MDLPITKLRSVVFATYGEYYASEDTLILTVILNLRASYPPCLSEGYPSPIFSKTHPIAARAPQRARTSSSLGYAGDTVAADDSEASIAQAGYRRELYPLSILPITHITPYLIRDSQSDKGFPA